MKWTTKANNNCHNNTNTNNDNDNDDDDDNDNDNDSNNNTNTNTNTPTPTPPTRTRTSTPTPQPPPSPPPPPPSPTAPPKKKQKDNHGSHPCPLAALLLPSLGVLVGHPIQEGHQRKVRQRVSLVLHGVILPGGHQTLRKPRYRGVHVRPQQRCLPERLNSTWKVAGGGNGRWGGANSFFACLSCLTNNHASLSRRSTVPTPSGDTSNIWALSTLLPYST